MSMLNDAIDAPAVVRVTGTVTCAPAAPLTVPRSNVAAACAVETLIKISIRLIITNPHLTTNSVALIIAPLFSNGLNKQHAHIHIYIQHRFLTDWL